MYKRLYLYSWSSATFSLENDKYLAYIIEELVITCDETMNTTKTVPTKTVNEKR